MGSATHGIGAAMYASVLQYFAAVMKHIVSDKLPKKIVISVDLLLDWTILSSLQFKNS